MEINSNNLINKDIFQTNKFDNIKSTNRTDKETELFKKIISHFYLGFYYGKLGYINNLEETNKLFNYDRIYHCIKNSGINTICIENKKQTMATVNMITDAYINKPPSSVGNITLNAANRVLGSG